ncbi:MAG: ATP-binding protein, partial [Chloroflexi bacterium]|nr:ATP-binding protein [Chloroflexota bacterium]
LFGRRDPDDFYSQHELPLLQSLANQTAIALSNIIQTERLKAIYEADVNRYEQERLRLALGLHDSVLNQMAAMLMKDTIPLSPDFQKAYNGVIQRLREIVSDLRLPMLNHGLKPAIEELADNLMERSADTVSIVVNVQADEQRYPENIERNVYRIVQQACENSLRHGKAREISIDGSLNDLGIELRIEDNGIGFDIKQGFELDDLLANNHFGMAGMIERGMLIGGSVNIDSAPNAGTRIRITWSADHA